jgi:hypothetical protein
MKVKSKNSYPFRLPCIDLSAGEMGMEVVDDDATGKCVK